MNRAGLLKSTRGYRAPGRVVSASLVEYEALLPLFRGPRHVEDALALPKELDEAPAEVMREALQAEVTTPIKNGALTGFVLTAARVAFPEGRPALIPARVGRVIEARRPDAVYLATTEEERAFLSVRQKPYLRADPDEAELLVEAVGCRKFEDSFSFSLLVDGRQGEERVIDLYTGLRATFVEDKVVNATVAKAVQITKRVTTEDGVEDQTLEWHLEGLTLVVRADLDEERVLQILNGAFDLRLSNAELSDILRARDDQRLETQRQAARAASGDAERLEIFFGDDTLKEILPKGLWQALEGQGLVDDSTSVAKLFLTVYGSDSIRFLKDQFSAEGYTDVPTTWAGRIDRRLAPEDGVRHAVRRASRSAPERGVRRARCREAQSSARLPERDQPGTQGSSDVPGSRRSRAQGHGGASHGSREDPRRHRDRIAALRRRRHEWNRAVDRAVGGALRAGGADVRHRLALARRRASVDDRSALEHQRSSRT